MNNMKWGIIFLISITVISIGHPILAEKTSDPLTEYVNKVWVNYEKGYTIREQIQLNKNLDEAMKDADLTFEQNFQQRRYEGLNDSILESGLSYQKQSYKYGTSFYADLQNVRQERFDEHDSHFRLGVNQPLFNGVTMAMCRDKIEKLNYKRDDLFVIENENQIVNNAVYEYLEYNYLLFKAESIQSTITYLEELLSTLANKKQTNIIYLKLSLNNAKIRLIQTERLILDKKVKLADLAGAKNQEFQIGFDNYITKKENYFNKLLNAYDEYNRLALEDQKLKIEVQKLMVNYNQHDNDSRFALQSRVEFDQPGETLGESLEFDKPSYYLGVSWEYNFLERENDWRLEMAKKELADLEWDNQLLKQNANDRSSYGKESLQKIEKEVNLLEDEQVLLKEKSAIEKQVLLSEGDTSLKEITETIEAIEENQKKCYRLIIDTIQEYYDIASSNVELKNILVKQ
jgi:hypothetical protein